MTAFEEKYRRKTPGVEPALAAARSSRQGDAWKGGIPGVQRRPASRVRALGTDQFRQCQYGHGSALRPAQPHDYRRRRICHLPALRHADYQRDRAGAQSPGTLPQAAPARGGVDNGIRPAQVGDSTRGCALHHRHRNQAQAPPRTEGRRRFAGRGQALRKYGHGIDSHGMVVRAPMAADRHRFLLSDKRWRMRGGEGWICASDAPGVLLATA